MKWIQSQRLIRYLANHGIQPIYDCGYGGYYSRTPQLHSLLDRYTIEYLCIPNRL